MNRGQKKRTVIVLAALVAGLVVTRQLVKRGDLLEAVGRGSIGTSLELVAPTIEKGSRSTILQAARQHLEREPATEIADAAEPGQRLVMLSLSRTTETALVGHGTGTNLDDAIAAAARALLDRATPEAISQGRLKVDVALSIADAETFDATGKSAIERGAEGLWLPKSELLLLPEEILSRRLVNSDGQLRPARIERYLKEGGRAETRLASGEGEPGAAYHRVALDSSAEGEGRRPKRLFRGNDRSPAISPQALLDSARAGGDYLLRHQGEDGNFNYIYEPKKETLGDGYNLLRHAGTCYALAQLYRATHDERTLQGARRGIEALLERAAPPKAEHAEAGFEAIVSPGREAKLGGAALAILAIVEHQLASDDETFMPRAELLARFLLHQQEDTGRFLSKYFYGEPDPEPFESIYYPGEAILALARLYRLDPRREWLDAATGGAEWLITVRDGDKKTADLPHDHWLLMGLDELHELTGKELYAQHAKRIAEAIVNAQRTRADRLDWIGSFYDPPRSTPTATRAEGLVAMHRLARRIGDDSQPTLQALLRMATFQRRCQLAPENALYLPRPDRALGGFKRSLENWQVRIDYVQHNLSALLGLRSILLEQANAPL